MQSRMSEGRVVLDERSYSSVTEGVELQSSLHIFCRFAAGKLSVLIVFVQSETPYARLPTNNEMGKRVRSRVLILKSWRKFQSQKHISILKVHLGLQIINLELWVVLICSLCLIVCPSSTISNPPEGYVNHFLCFLGSFVSGKDSHEIRGTEKKQVMVFHFIDFFIGSSFIGASKVQLCLYVEDHRFSQIAVFLDLSNWSCSSHTQGMG